VPCESRRMRSRRRAARRSGPKVTVVLVSEGERAKRWGASHGEVWPSQAKEALLPVSLVKARDLDGLASAAGRVDEAIAAEIDPDVRIGPAIGVEEDEIACAPIAIRHERQLLRHGAGTARKRNAEAGEYVQHKTAAIESVGGRSATETITAAVETQCILEQRRAGTTRRLEGGGGHRRGSMSGSRRLGEHRPRLPRRRRRGCAAEQAGAHRGAAERSRWDDQFIMISSRTAYTYSETPRQIFVRQKSDTR